jgi:hypothetical protein
VIEEGRLRTTPEAFRRRFTSEQPMRIAIEAGTHSPWASRVLEECGHEVLVGCRTQLVNHVRGAVKSFGARLPKCPAVSFHKRAAEHIPEALWPALGPILEQIGSLTQRIRDYERKLEEISKAHYPETQLLRQVEGMGRLQR